MSEHSRSYPHCYHRATDVNPTRADCIVLRCCIHHEEREAQVR